MKILTQPLLLLEELVELSQTDVISDYSYRRLTLGRGAAWTRALGVSGTVSHVRRTYGLPAGREKTGNDNDYQRKGSCRQ